MGISMDKHVNVIFIPHAVVHTYGNSGESNENHWH